jgi:hypothetical protein
VIPMAARPRSSRARAALIVIRSTWGTLLLLAPDRLVAPPGATGTNVPGGSRSVLVGARLLGVRQVLEASLLARHADQAPPVWSIAVDAVHALSMLGLAAAAPPLRGAALRSAACAVALATLSAYER